MHIQNVIKRCVQHMHRMQVKEFNNEKRLNDILVDFDANL